MKLPSSTAGESLAENAAPDPFEGVGGSYRIDPDTGLRIQIVPPPDQPALPAAGAPEQDVPST